MPFDLTLGEILRTCRPTYFARGKDYYAKKKVAQLEWDDEAQTLFSIVSGSGRKQYSQEIIFDRLNGRDPFEGFCSCPVAYDCKHVVAALLEWIDRRGQIEEQSTAKGGSRALQRWLEETDEALTDEAESYYPEPGQPCLLYLLKSINDTRSGAIAVEVYKSRRLKKGGWGKANRYNFSQLNSSYYSAPQGTTPLDIEIAGLLDQGGLSYMSPTIEGDSGLLALVRLLRSGRCYYNSFDNPPMSFAPPKDACFEWVEGEDGITNLDIALEGLGADWVSLPTIPPWYLDPATQECGVVAHPLSAALYSSLMKLPPVESEQLPELTSFLLGQLPVDTIPMPIELNLQQCDQPPVSHLILTSFVDSSGRRRHIARLRFNYGPVALPPFFIDGKEILMVRQDNVDWQIKRDSQFEIVAKEMLTHMGFSAVAVQSGEHDLFFATDTVTESAAMWREFLAVVPKMKEDGWLITTEEDFRLRFETADNLQAEIDEGEMGWFDIGLNIEYNGHRIPLLPLLTQWSENNDLEMPLLVNVADSDWLEVPISILKPVLNTLIELSHDPHLSDNGRLRLPQPQAHSLVELEEGLGGGEHHLEWQGGKKIRNLAKKLRKFKGIEEVQAPAGLQAELRNYQLEGLSWLQFLREYSFNGILADDMGLGKTIQTLAHLLVEKDAGRLDRPALIVAPTSVISNWKRECERFTPGLKPLVLHGIDRVGSFSSLDKYDLIITSYALLNRDIELHRQNEYHSLILDEAQAIKNPKAKVAQAAREIECRHRLCLTGTPMENHLGELWSLFYFLMPGFLGDQKRFTKMFRTPIEKQFDHERQEQLQKRVAPFVLRRDKSEVVKELPPKTMMVREVELNGPQTKLYETLRLSMTSRIDKLLEKQGIEKSHIQILDALLKLRQVCCDPRLVKLESARKVKHSAKLELLMDMVLELLEEGRKIIIFSQFTSMLSLMEDELKANDIDYSKLTGRTRKRDEAISAFQDGDVPLFLISLKAGGVGLNLTTADTVIHYDPWWNPAVENQATDRAHRIGQKNPVFVYKLVAKGTVEEKILQLQEKKERLAQAVYQKGKSDGEGSGVSSDELLSLLQPLDMAE